MGALVARLFWGGIASLIASRPAFAGDGDAAYGNDQTPDATKPALGGFCFASYLVGRGNLNLAFITLIFIINIHFYFELEYQLEYLANCAPPDRPFVFDLTTVHIRAD
jgi:hypothetical protein